MFLLHLLPVSQLLPLLQAEAEVQLEGLVNIYVAALPARPADPAPFSVQARVELEVEAVVGDLEVF